MPAHSGVLLKLYPCSGSQMPCSQMISMNCMPPRPIATIRLAMFPAANSRLPHQSICACLRTPMSCSTKYAHTVPNTPIGAETRKIRCQFTGARTSAGAVGVVEGAGAGRGVQGREGLRVERVDEPVVVDEPGGDDLLLPGRAGDRAGGGVVPAGLAVGVAVRVVAEQIG